MTDALSARKPSAGVKRTGQRLIRRHLLAMIVVSQLMITLDASVIVTALPKIRTGLHLASVNLSWVQNASAAAPPQHQERRREPRSVGRRRGTLPHGRVMTSNVTRNEVLCRHPRPPESSKVPEESAPDAGVAVDQGSHNPFDATGAPRALASLANGPLTDSRRYAVG
jgi:hypothetical protein